MASFLTKMMEKFQPEGHYAPLQTNSDVYLRSFKTLVLAEFTILEKIGKWKLGQNRSPELRRQIIQKLRERNLGADQRTAKEVSRWLDQQP
jgi:predicted FMN-binding regulatory protein PaiB